MQELHTLRSMVTSLLLDASVAVIFMINIINDYNRYTHSFMSQSVTTKEGNSLKTETDLPANLKAVRVYEFIDTGMIVVSVILI